jgi:hypothetical protein
MIYYTESTETLTYKKGQRLKSLRSCICFESIVHMFLFRDIIGGQVGKKLTAKVKIMFLHSMSEFLTNLTAD